MRLTNALIMAILIGIGIHLSTPGHHATNIFVDYISDTFADMPILKNILPEWAAQTGNIKALALIAMTWFGFMHLSSIDPLSNTPFLRAKAHKESRSPTPWFYLGMPELEYYAAHTPSTKIVTWCKACPGDLGCDNQLESVAAPGVLALWLTVLKELPSQIVHEHLFLTNRCRMLALFRISTLSAAVALIPFWLLARCFELLRGVPIDTNPQLIAYTCCLGIFGMIVNRLFFGGEQRPGFWGHLKDNVESIFQLPAIDTLIQSHVCSRTARAIVTPPTPGRSLHHAMTLVNTLDVLVERKAVAILKNIPRTPTEYHLGNILDSAAAMLKELARSGATVQAVLLRYRPDSEPLSVWATTASPDAPVEASIICDNTTPVANSLAQQSIARREPVSAVGAGIPRAHFARALYHSAMAYPLYPAESILAELRKTKRDSGEHPFGVLVVASNDKEHFSEASHERNLILVRPFARRLIYEAAIEARRPNAKASDAGHHNTKA